MYQCFQCELVEMAHVKSTFHLSNLVGTGRELLVPELPTVRDILRYGVYRKNGCWGSGTGAGTGAGNMAAGAGKKTEFSY